MEKCIKKYNMFYMLIISKKKEKIIIFLFYLLCLICNSADIEQENNTVVKNGVDNPVFELNDIPLDDKENNNNGVENNNNGIENNNNDVENNNNDVENNNNTGVENNNNTGVENNNNTGVENNNNTGVENNNNTGGENNNNNMNMTENNNICFQKLKNICAKIKEFMLYFFVAGVGIDRSLFDPRISVINKKASIITSVLSVAILYVMSAIITNFLEEDIKIDAQKVSLVSFIYVVNLLVNAGRVYTQYLLNEVEINTKNKTLFYLFTVLQIIVAFIFVYYHAFLRMFSIVNFASDYILESVIISFVLSLVFLFLSMLTYYINKKYGNFIFQLYTLFSIQTLLNFTQIEIMFGILLYINVINKLHPNILLLLLSIVFVPLYSFFHEKNEQKFNPFLLEPLDDNTDAECVIEEDSDET